MKLISATLLLATAALAGCTSTGGNNNVNGNNANLRGTNTNTGYVSNSETNVKPAMPTNPTNITPPNVNMGKSNANTKSNTNVHSNSNTKKP